MTSVLLIDDDTELTKLLEEYLEEEQFHLDSAHDGIVGLELGADDYLPKPFNPRELVARLRAILRRTTGGGAAASSKPVHLADVELHPESRSVTCGGKAVTLTGAEFDLLYTFLRSPGKIISREDLTQAALGRPMSPMDRSIDVHVSNLRRKLGSYDGNH